MYISLKEYTVHFKLHTVPVRLRIEAPWWIKSTEHKLHRKAKENKNIQRELRTGFEPVTWMCERPTTAHAFIRCPSGTARQVVRYKLCQNSGRDYMRNFELKKKSYINMCPTISRYITTGILIFQIHTLRHCTVSALTNIHAYSHLSNTIAA
jgi:hypothetical protein